MSSRDAWFRLGNFCAFLEEWASLDGKEGRKAVKIHEAYLAFLKRTSAQQVSLSFSAHFLQHYHVAGSEQELDPTPGPNQQLPQIVTSAWEDEFSPGSSDEYNGESNLLGPCFWDEELRGEDQTTTPVVDQVSSLSPFILCASNANNFTKPDSSLPRKQIESVEISQGAPPSKVEIDPDLLDLFKNLPRKRGLDNGALQQLPASNSANSSTPRYIRGAFGGGRGGLGRGRGRGKTSGGDY